MRDSFSWVSLRGPRGFVDACVLECQSVCGVVVVSSGQWSEKREFLIRGVRRASRCIIAYKVVDTRLCCCGQCVSSGQWRGKREFLVRGVRRASRCINADTRFAS